MRVDGACYLFIRERGGRNLVSYWCVHLRSVRTFWNSLYDHHLYNLKFYVEMLSTKVLDCLKGLEVDGSWFVC